MPQRQLSYRSSRQPRSSKPELVGDSRANIAARLDALKDRIAIVTANYSDQCKLNLLPIGNAETKLCELLEKKPEELTKHARILSQIKQAAGVIIGEASPTQIVQIASLQVVQIGLRGVFGMGQERELVVDNSQNIEQIDAMQHDQKANVE